MRQRTLIAGWLGLTLCLLVFLAGCGAPPQKVALDWREAAENALLDRRFQDAAALCNEQLARDPDIVAAHTLLGRVYHLQERYREAIAEFSVALRLHPNDMDLLYRRSESYRCHGMLAEADVDLLAARALNPKLEAAYLNSPSRFMRDAVIPNTKSDAPDAPAKDAKELFSSNGGGGQPSDAEDSKAGDADGDEDPSKTPALADDRTTSPDANSSTYASRSSSLRSETDAADRRDVESSPHDLRRKSPKLGELKYQAGRKLAEKTKRTKPSFKKQADEKGLAETPLEDEREMDSRLGTPLKPVISSALPRFLNSPTAINELKPFSQDFSGDSLSSARAIPPLTTGLHSELPANRGGMGAPSQFGGYGSSLNSPPSPYARINPIYAPQQPKGMTGLGINFEPRKNLSTSLQGTGIVTGSGASSARLSTGFSRRPLGAAPTPSDDGAGSHLRSGAKPYLGVPGRERDDGSLPQRPYP